jgi:hypothetical protein
MAGKSRGWQSQAWSYFDSVGELRYLANWIGNVLSRAELHAAKRDGNSLVPLTEGPAREAMDALYGGPQGQSQMLQLLGVDTTVSGEGYIAARNEDEWDVLASGKVTQAKNGGVITANFGDGNARYEMKKEDLLIRVWTPHPTNPTEADAPTRSNLGTLAQITGYDAHISAQLTSRLAGAGILFMPSDIQFASSSESDPEASQADVFMQTLHEAMEAAKDDRTSPAAFVPIVVTMPGEFVDKVAHLKFWSDLDQSVIEMRQAAIHRFAIGMDVPPEVLMGNSDSTHWNAWLSEESAVKAHLEPRLGVIAHALTVGYLRPALSGVVPEDELDDYCVIADTTNIRVRPNKSAESLELHDRALINSEAVRRETGFKPEDAMDNDEFSKWLLQRVSTGAVTPEITAEALRLLGAKIDTAVVMPDAMQEQPTHTQSDTGIEVVRQLPNQGEARDRANEPLVAACSVLVYRALERAGNRLRNAHPMSDTQAMASHTVYTVLTSPDVSKLLAGAWDCAPEALAGYTDDVQPVVDVLDFYVRGLLSSKRPHNPNTLARLLEASHLEAVTVNS